MKELGRHLVLELFDCDPIAIGSIETVKTAMIKAAEVALATIVDVIFRDFSPHGIVGAVIIAESHLSIRTWPEYRYAAVDIFTCSETMRPEVAAEYLAEQLGAGQTSVIEISRGLFLQGAEAKKPQDAVSIK